MFFSNSPTCLTILHRNRMKSRRTLHRMKSWLKSPKVGTLHRENRTFFQHFDQFGLWGSLGASGDQSVSLGRLWGARMAQDGAKMVKDGAKPTVRPTDRPSDRPSLRPTDRPSARPTIDPNSRSTSFAGPIVVVVAVVVVVVLVVVVVVHSSSSSSSR